MWRVAAMGMEHQKCHRGAILSQVPGRFGRQSYLACCRVYFHKRPMGDHGEFSPPIPCPDEYQPLAETGGTAVHNGYIAD